MPIYEYLCSGCGFKFELLRPLSRAAEAAACPRCQQSAKRVLSVFARLSKSADEDGLTSAAGGDACAGCSAISCASCNL